MLLLWAQFWPAVLSMVAPSLVANPEEVECESLGANPEEVECDSLEMPVHSLFLHEVVGCSLFLGESSHFLMRLHRSLGFSSHPFSCTCYSDSSPSRFLSDCSWEPHALAAGQVC